MADDSKKKAKVKALWLGMRQSFIRMDDESGRWSLREGIKFMRVSIIVDGQTISALNNYTGWRIDWKKLKDFYTCAFGELHKAYYCSGGIKNNATEDTRARIKGFLKYLQDIGWIVPDQYTKRKPNDTLNVDATVGFYLAECLEYTDVLVLMANDGDYFQSLIPYLKNGKLIFCVGNPNSISTNLKDIATVIDIKNLKQFIAETSES